MKNIFEKATTKLYQKVVSELDLAIFESGAVHEVYSTFALARDAEWSGRLFVLEMKEDDEEGIGTQINVKHVSPAFVGEALQFRSTYEGINECGEIMTSFKVYSGERFIAHGTQGQKILKKEKIDSYFISIQKQP